MERLLFFMTFEGKMMLIADAKRQREGEVWRAVLVFSLCLNACGIDGVCGVIPIGLFRLVSRGRWC